MSLWNTELLIQTFQTRMLRSFEFLQWTIVTIDEQIRASMKATICSPGTHSKLCRDHSPTDADEARTSHKLREVRS